MNQFLAKKRILSKYKNFLHEIKIYYYEYFKYIIIYETQILAINGEILLLYI